MQRFFRSARWGMVVLVMLGLLTALPAAVTTAIAAEKQPAAGDIPVRKVMLFSSGVGYFEHLGVVTGETSAELRFKASQINDILKSLVLQDLDGGTIDSVLYPSQDPLAKTLGGFQVDLSRNPSLAELLTQLRGARVTLSSQAERLQGSILGLEKQQESLKDTNQVVDVWVLNLISDGTIRSVPLDAVERLELEDPVLQEELHSALLALAQSREQAKKPLTIRFKGQGERRVRLGYLIETPLWKTSYRLLLPDTAEVPAKLQGWALVENQTDHDWDDVQLSLVSGRPISFVEELYTPLYLPRPVVRPELYAGLRPQTYEAGQEAASRKTAQQQVPAAAPSPRTRAIEGTTERRAEAERGDTTLDPLASVIASAAAASAGELFQYTLAHVSLPRQRSAMLPLISSDIAAERVSIYNRGVLAQHPLNGVRLQNTTGLHLLHGPITVLDAGTYGGDARLDQLPPGQERLISYGIDLQVQVNAAQARQEQMLQTGKLVKGVLHLTRKNVVTQEYTAANKADHDKLLIVEHPLRKGWELADSPEPLEVTETLYRFRQAIPAGNAATLTVKEEQIQGETIALLASDLGQLEFYSRTGEIPKAVRDALIKAMTFKSAMIDTERQIKERQQQLSEIAQEQQRIRDNMATVNQTSQYYTRLLSKLNDQETRIEKLHSEIDQLQAQYNRQRKELETYLTNTTVG